MTLLASVDAPIRSGEEWEARRATLRVVELAIAGATVGTCAWGMGEGTGSLLILIALPWLWGCLRVRSEALALMLAYYLAGSRDLAAGAEVFFGESTPYWMGVALWLGAGLLLALPFTLLWSKTGFKRAVGFVAATVVCIPPPLGIIGWLNPISVAGVTFPATGAVGLLLTLILFFALAGRNRPLLLGVSILSLMAHLSEPEMAPKPPAGWTGFDTNFGGLNSDGADQAALILSSMQRVAWLNKVAADMPSDVTLVLPETVLGRFDGALRIMTSEAENELRSKRSRILVGGELPLGEWRQYRNSLFVLGASDRDDEAAFQGIPVPVSMWKPWAKDGATADLFGLSNIIKVGGIRVGVAICYEQLLAFSVLRILNERPSIFIAVSNVWWAKSLNIPNIQTQTIKSTAKLFHIPVIVARNI